VPNLHRPRRAQPVHAAHRAPLAPFVLLALLPLGSCAYWRERATDLHDCILYRWHTDAFGVAVEAKLGPLDAALGGWYAEYGWGKDTFWQQPGFVMTNHGMGVPFTTVSPLAYGGTWDRLFATSAYGNHPGAPDAFTDVHGWLGVSDVFDLDNGSPFVLSPQRRVADLFGIEVGLAPLFWGARVGVNVAELADALLGFVGIDVMGDVGVARPPTMPFVPAAER
jgi:hypothetical protein